jgi:hypothetical protein
MTSREEQAACFARYDARERFEGAMVVPHISMPYPALGLSREVVPFEGGGYMGRERRWADANVYAVQWFDMEADAIAWANTKWANMEGGA